MSTLIHTYTIDPKDVAAFEGTTIHPVCSTYTLAREIEFATRQHIFDLKQDSEEGIGIHLSIDHLSPAHVGETITITSSIDSFSNGNLTCNYDVKVGDRLIAQGQTGQKILPRDIIQKIFSN